MEHPSPTHVGPYRLLHLIGEGGMGRVFAAVHEQMGQQVALKLLSPDPTGNPQRFARFRQEAQILARIQHPGVVRVFHYDRLGDTVFLAMELLRGFSLREWMQRQPAPVPFQSSLALCEQIATIMVDVHAQGVVHRDLKPENVFLCSGDLSAPDFRIKLLDFGTARLRPAPDEVLNVTQIHTHESTVLGTYTHMAPEQLGGGATVDGRADVYALGVLAFELLAGRGPFPYEHPYDVITAHRSEEPPPLKPLVPALPGILSAFIARMLAKDPAERPTMLQCRDMFGAPWEKSQEACPVPGLAPFKEEQAQLFFGRKDETQALLSLLEEARAGLKRWVQLEGASGVGKSSLLQAGVLPRLRESPPIEGPRWLVVPLRLADEPLCSLARALASAYAGTGFGGTHEELARVLAKDSEALRDFITRQTPQGCLLLLVIDPMEELFTLGEAECRQLDALLSAALAAPECPFRLLTSLRSDFFHRMELLPAVARHLPRAARYPLLPMEEAALAQVIQGMAAHAGLLLGDGLAARMVRDARGEGGRLPLLGHALRELWALRGGMQLTLQDYERLGGVGGALARQAEALLDSLGPEGKERAKWLLLHLVQVGRGVQDTRRPRSRAEVLAAAGGGREAEDVLLRLTGMRTASGGTQTEQGLRLVLLSGEAQPAHQRVELVHETLLHRVPSLAAWIEQERALLNLEADLEAMAHAWEQAGCPAKGLPGGDLLTHYRGGLDVVRRTRLKRRVSARAARFLQTAEQLERRLTWSRRALRAASLVAGVVIAFSAVRAEQERQHAELEQQRAEMHLLQHIAGIDRFVRDSDWKLSRLPNTLEERRKLLLGYQATLESLPEQEHQRPEVLLALIGVRHRLADLSFHNEPLDQAEARLLRARWELDGARAQWPWNSEFQEESGLNHSKLGKAALAQGRWMGARDHFVRALAELEGLGVGRGGEENARRTLAVSLAELAEVELVLGHLVEARTQYDRAISLHRQNTGPYSHYLLALTLSDRGEVERQTAGVKAAQPYLEEALQHARASLQAEPGNQLFRWVLARTLTRFGALMADQNRFTEADASYLEAQEHAKAVHQSEPTHKRYALVLVQSLLHRGALLQKHHQAALAQPLLTQGCELALRFQCTDGKDVRFRFLQCSSVQEEK